MEMFEYLLYRVRPFGRLPAEVPIVRAFPARPVAPSGAESTAGPESDDALFERLRSLRGLLPGGRRNPSVRVNGSLSAGLNVNTDGQVDRALWRRYRPPGRKVQRNAER